MTRNHISLLASGLVLVLSALPAMAFGDQKAMCTEVSFSVSLGEGMAASYRVAGQLCQPHRGHEQALQILVHGSTYNRSYWDFPFMSRQYSYVRHANAAGFSTLAIDRLGSGQSDRPPGELVSVHASAYTIHQIVTAVRNGLVADADGHPLRYRQVLLVGHSFGSNISWTEAGIYGDVDALVLTAISHDQTPPGAILTQIYAYPAQLDPLFANLPLPSGYLTTVPGKRGEMFYYLPGASADVIAVDEATKDTLPLGVLFDQFTTYGLTSQIHVPVLNVVGDFDTLACELPSCTVAGTLVNEAGYYATDAAYTQLIVPNAGHSVNLHENAPAWYHQANVWAREVLLRARDHHRPDCPRP
jgi:pimeloyl-ACP methyl ester carboxylesterase